MIEPLSYMLKGLAIGGFAVVCLVSGAAWTILLNDKKQDGVALVIVSTLLLGLYGGFLWWVLTSWDGQLLWWSK